LETVTILSCFCQAMFTGSMCEAMESQVPLNGIEAPVMELLLNYAYTSEITITKSNVLSLLSAANLLEILPVRDACCQFLHKHMDANNCVGIHCFAETHACTFLQKEAKDYTLEHFKEVVQHDEFATLSTSKLIEFISSDDLAVSDEKCVFQAVLKWLEHHRDSRKDQFGKVLEHVRLPLLNPYFLHDCVESLDVIQQSSECQQLVEEAKLYHLLPDRRHELATARTKPRLSSGIVDVIVAVGGEDDKVVLRKHGMVVSGSNILYLAGGESPDGRASAGMWKYDPVFDGWMQLADMNVPRSELGLVMVDGMVYAVGGWEGSTRLETAECYDPATNTWSFIAPMKLAVTSPAVVSHNGYLYVAGGAVLEDGDGIDKVQRYDPKTNTWTELAQMLIPRSGAVACVLQQKIYVIGGWHASTENTNKVECYDIKSNRWEFRAPMIEHRYRPGVAVLNDKVYVLGGEEGWDSYHDTIECYDPVSNTWGMVSDMPSSRSWLSCAALKVKREVLMGRKS
ncbi:unnamed protein product, partial [Darwinula stevensoni]